MEESFKRGESSVLRFNFGQKCVDLEFEHMPNKLYY
jgi:hypothetical protein